MTFFHPRVVSLCLFAVCLAGLAACKSAPAGATTSASAADISTAPTFNAAYQVRNPRVCAKVMSAPNPAQAAALVQCSTESDTTGGSTPLITVTTGVQVEMGSARPYMPGADFWSDIDPRAPVYPIRGQGTMWQCFPATDRPAGQNCMNYPPAPGGQGACYKTTFGDWTCKMTLGGPRQVQNLKGPTTY